MPLQTFCRAARASRAALLPVALCLAASGAQAQLVSGVLTLTADTLGNLTDTLLAASPATYGRHRDASVVAAHGPSCRAQARHRGEQRVSYGNASPRHRQLLNDCTLLGIDTTSVAP